MFSLFLFRFWGAFLGVWGFGCVLNGHRHHLLIRRAKGGEEPGHQKRRKRPNSHVWGGLGRLGFKGLGFREKRPNPHVGSNVVPFWAGYVGF